MVKPKSKSAPKTGAPKRGIKKPGVKPAAKSSAKAGAMATEQKKKRFYAPPKSATQAAADAKKRAKKLAAKKLAKRPYSDVAKLEARPGSKPAAKSPAKAPSKTAPKVQRPYGIPEQLRDAALKVLDERQAEDILTLDLTGRSSLADYIIIASGRAVRQIGAIAHYLREAFDALGVKPVRSEGLPQGDWVLVDGGDVIVHLFRPEVRAYYNIETIWAADQ